MQINTIPAGRALDWFKQGWAIFSKDMVTWVLMTLVMGVGAFILNFLPIIGQIVLCLIMPALLGGMLYAAQQADKGQPIKLEYLWMVLLDGQKRIPFIALGGILFGAVILVGVVSVAFIGDSLLRGANAGLLSFGLGGMLFMLIVGFSVFVLFNYTAALMMLRDMPLVDAFKACAGVASTQVVPLLVFFLLYAVLAFIASIPFGLGMLVLLPVTVAAVYTSYQELFAA